MSIDQCNTYTPSFFITPYRIINLPGITLTFLKFYETIFQFWNKGLACYLTNTALKERTGISSSSTISEAFAFFEKHNEMQRITKDGRRFIVQPCALLEIPDPDKNYDDEPGGEEENTKESASQDNMCNLSENRDTPFRSTDSMPLSAAIHNIKNINIKNINKKYKKDFSSFSKDVIHKKNEPDISAKPDSSQEGSFADFWKVYPVKKDKAVCIKIWKKKKLDGLSSNIINKLKTQVSHDVQWQQGYIPNPSTYLRNDRWEDDISTKKPGLSNRLPINHDSTDWANRFMERS